MSILPQHAHPLKALEGSRKSTIVSSKGLRRLRYVLYARTYRHCSLPTRIYCSETTTERRRTTSRIVVVEPKIVRSPRERGPSFVDDPTLKSTWSHRAWLASGCTAVLVSLAKSILGSMSSQIWIEPILASLVGYILADLGSGIYHWGIDNYGDANTPIFGSQIEAFQGHHKWPWTITKRQFANNLHGLARVITFAVLPVDLLSGDPVLHAFVGVFSGSIMFSQQFHAWAHGTKSKLPRLVVALQDAGVLVSRSQHAAHHRPPYDNNYCIVSGAWNEVLDKSKFFEMVEMVLYLRLGVRPRSWSEPSSEWTTEENEEASTVFTLIK